MTATYCEHGFLVEGSRHECEQCKAPVREARKWIAKQDPVKLQADAQALADVRTLDEWAAAKDDRSVDLSCGWCVAFKDKPHLQPPGQVRVRLLVSGDPTHIEYGDTPDAARHAAAEWVRTETRARAAIEKADRILDAHAREQQSGTLTHVSTIGSVGRGAPGKEACTCPYNGVRPVLNARCAVHGQPAPARESCRPNE